jgi:hypothetical protein
LLKSNQICFMNLCVLVILRLILSVYPGRDSAVKGFGFSSDIKPELLTTIIWQNQLQLLNLNLQQLLFMCKIQVLFSFINGDGHQKNSGFDNLMIPAVQVPHI